MNSWKSQSYRVVTHSELSRNQRWWNLDAVSLFSLQFLDARGFHRHEILRVAKDLIESWVFSEAREYQGWQELTMLRACPVGPRRSVAIPLSCGAAVPSGGVWRSQLCGVSLLARVPSCCDRVCSLVFLAYASYGRGWRRRCLLIPVPRSVPRALRFLCRVALVPFSLAHGIPQGSSPGPLVFSEFPLSQDTLLCSHSFSNHPTQARCPLCTLGPCM